MPPSPFAVAGMASTSGSLTHSSSLTHSHNHNQGHAPALPSWGGDLSQRASHYQPGYLMSASQAQNAPQSTDDRDARAPVVPTKAKMNQAFSMSMSGGGMSGGGSTNDGWGMDSMFQSARQRPPLADADAPPMASVNDIPMAGSANYPQQPQQQQQRTPAFGRFSSPASPPPHSRTPASPSASSFQSQSHAQGQGQAPALLIFGYPPDKYTLTLSFFAALAPLAPGAPPALAPEVAGNCFLLWYKEVGDAVRAVRKSGVVLGGGGGEGGGGSGGWMVGVRWAVSLFSVLRFFVSSSLPPCLCIRPPALCSPIRLLAPTDALPSLFFSSMFFLSSLRAPSPLTPPPTPSFSTHFFPFVPAHSCPSLTLFLLPTSIHVSLPIFSFRPFPALLHFSLPLLLPTPTHSRYPYSPYVHFPPLPPPSPLVFPFHPSHRPSPFLCALALLCTRIPRSPLPFFRLLLPFSTHFLLRSFDPAAAEALLAQPAAPRHTSPDPMMVDPEYDSSTSSSPYAQGRGGGAEYAGTVGTPLRLAPSTAAFRHSNNSGARPQAKAAAPPAQGGQAPAEAGGAGNVNANGGKGVLGQVSDMIFGW
ncbi:hypothetical protein C8R44DRAFT_988006 [Mycena epipterygia]|nr:hypothetical protein C8R44DRAFT_988006 [Mycena epipterygia]